MVDKIGLRMSGRWPAIACLVALLALSVRDAEAGRNRWTASGPASVVNVLVPHPQEEGVLYAGGEEGFYQTADGGLTWVGTGEAVRGRNVLSLAVDPEDGQRIYAGLNVGLFLSADGGSTWNAVQGPGSGVLSVAVSPVAGDRVYAGTFGRGIFVSDDRGESWSPGGVEIAAEMVFAIAAAAVDLQTVYAGTADGFFTSTDGGASWEALGVELAGQSVRSIHVSAVDPNLILVGVFGGGVYRSRDGGESWDNLNSGLGDLGVRSLAVEIGSGRQAGDEGQLTGEPQVMYVATSTGGFYRTVDGGANWLPVNSGLPGLAARAVLFDPGEPNRVLGAGMAAGVWEIDFDPEPQIEMSAASVDFGEVDVGVLSIREVTLSNTGTADLIVLELELAQTGLSVGLTPPFAIPPDQARAVEVRFLPQREGELAGTLVVRSNDPDEPEVEVAINGSGIQPRLVAELTQVRFADIRVGEFADTTIVVTNAGTADIFIRNAFFDNATFRLLAFEPRSLRRGERMAFPVRFTPEGLLGQAGRLVLLTDALTQPRFEIKVDGEGVAPLIRLSAPTVDFGTIDVKGTRAAAVEISNRGNADLVVERVELLSATFTVQNPEQAVVEPGGTLVLDLIFAPLVSGVVTDTARVFSNALPPFEVVELPMHGVGGALALTANAPVEVNPGSSYMLVADLDRDGARDLAVLDSLRGVVQVLLNDGQGLIPETNAAEYPGLLSAFEPWAEPVAIAAATIFDIGPDLIVGDRIAQSVSIIRNNGLGGFNDRREDIFIGHEIADLLAADLDADGDVDIAVASAEAPVLILLFNNGLGTFNARTTELVAGLPTAIQAANLNSDGRVDLAVTTADRDGVSILLGNGQGGFLRRSDFNAGLWPVDVAIVDYDADGDNDVVTANRGSLDFSVLTNDGFGDFPSEPMQISTGMQPDGRLPPLALALSDLSSDQFSDLVAVGPESPHIVFLENEAGATFAPKDLLTSTTPARDIEIVDMDGDGVNDLVVFSGVADQVQIFINENTRLQDPPRAPTAVVARDVPRDLGGQIEITWEAPDLDEQIGRTTTYTIYRATSAEGEFADIGEALAGFRSFVDSRAPMDQIFLYRIVAGNASARSNFSEAAAAISRPAPFFELELVNEPRFSVGDTLRVKTYVTPADHNVSALSLYITFDDSVLTLIGDGEGLEDGSSTPFRLDPTLRTDGLAWLPADRAVVENGLHTGSTNRIDLSLVGLVLPPGTEPVPLGEIWFQTSTHAVTEITIDDEVQRNRSSGVVDGETGDWIPPYIAPRSTQVTIKDFPVSGQVELEGRAGNPGAPMDLFFLDDQGRPLGSPLNDEDRVRPGIQVTLDAGGGFRLSQVPAGTYRIFGKSPSYLRGRVVLEGEGVGGVAVGMAEKEGSAGLLRPHLQFEWVDSDSMVVPILPAGDGNDDNRVNLADFGLLVRHFGVGADSTEAWERASALDFDANGLIGPMDFLLLASNFGEVGLELTASAAARPAPAVGWILAQTGADGVGEIHVGSAGAITGFALEVTGGTTLDETLVGTIWEGETALVRQWEKGGRRWLAGVLADPGRRVDGDGILARLPRHGSVEIHQVELLRDTQVVHPAIRPEGVRPQRSVLAQNFPNPFNPSTTIPFTVGALAAPQTGVAKSQPVELEIYNPLGQKLRTLVADLLAVGRHEVEWDGRDDGGIEVASGLYIYRLRIGAFVQTRRLLLVR